MKSKEVLHTEAEKVLESLGERIKEECEADWCSSEEANSLAMLVDSYSRLFELVK